jgi:uncharacterized protein with gpF-like domain
MTAEETLNLVSKQWCSLKDLMKLAGVGRNTALTIKSTIKYASALSFYTDWGYYEKITDFSRTVLTKAYTTQYNYRTVWYWQ